MVDGNATYLREYFPGQPFRKNKFSPAGNQYIVCTPSIDGAASRLRGPQGWWAVGLVLLACLWQLLFLDDRFQRRHDNGIGA